MIENYRALLESLNPEVSWKRCIEVYCKLKNYSSYYTKIGVPSDYGNPHSKRIEIQVQKFHHFKNVNPKIHVITLAGGPGAAGRSTDGTVQYLLEQFPNDQIAVYTIDHRGLSDSACIIKGCLPWREIRSHLPSITKNSPFPITHLTVHNAALDAAMLALAVKSADPSGRLIVYGASYGAALAHQAVKLVPDLFYSAVIESVPFLKGTSTDTFMGLAEHCALDNICRNKVGGDVWKEIQRAVRTIANLENKCSKILADQLDEIYRKTDYEGRIILLSMLLNPLFINSYGNRNVNFHSAQLIVPFLKITSDCISPKEYKDHVFKPLSKYFSSALINDIQNSQRSFENDAKYLDTHKLCLNTFVNTVILIDMYYYAGVPKIPKDITDFSGNLGYITDYNRRYNLLAPYLAGATPTDTRPLITKHTRIYIAHSRMDHQTSYPPAYDLYQSIDAPVKVWFFLENRGHVKLYGDCFQRLLGEILGLTGADESLLYCIKETNRKEALDWAFSHDTNLSALWKYVKTASGHVPASLQVKNVPNFTRGSSSTRTLSPVPADIRPSSPILPPSKWPPTIAPIITVALIICLSVIVGIVVYFKMLRKTAPIVSQNNNPTLIEPMNNPTTTQSTV